MRRAAGPGAARSRARRLPAAPETGLLAGVPRSPGVRRRRAARRQLALEARGVEPELPGVLDQVIVLERELALEQPIVHLPELPLRAGRFGRFGGVLRVQMQLGERKVAEHEPEARAQALPHL